MVIKLPNLKYYLKLWLSQLKASSRRKRAFLFILGVVLVSVLIVVVGSRPDYSYLEDVKEVNTQSIQQDPVLSKINLLYELPDDEKGYFGKIKDLKSLRARKDLLKKAKKGDVLIIYPDLTIIYDPINRVVIDINDD